MTAPAMELDHICLAVRKIDAARRVLEEFLGYRARTEKVVNTRQQVVVQFFSKPGALDIKLIEPTSTDSPLVASLKRGGGLHHLGFRVADTVAAHQALIELGARSTAEPQPGEAFNDALIAFVYLGSGLSIEVFDTDERRGQSDVGVED